MDEGITPIEDSFDAFSKALDEEMDNANFSDEERAILQRLTSRNFVYKVEAFFADFQNVEDTPENRLDMLKQFLGEFGFSLEDFVDEFNVYVELANFLQIDEDSPSIFQIVASISRIIRFSWGEDYEA